MDFFLGLDWDGLELGFKPGYFKIKHHATRLQNTPSVSKYKMF
jgi:hypothetical protein